MCVNTGRIIGVFFLLTFLVTSTAFAAEPDALAIYHQGVTADTIGAREQAFEKALALYMAKHNTMAEKKQANGLLCANIGNCYYNLGQLEEAIYYYQLAHNLRPRDETINASLKLALKQREEAIDIESNTVMQDLLFFHYSLSPAERIHLLILCAGLTALALLWLLVRPSITARYLSLTGGFISLCLAISLSVCYYAPKHMGIFMKQADVRRGAGVEYAPVTSRPFGGGSSIEVLALNNGWYQVKLNDGRNGYVAEEDLRFLTF